MNLSTFTYRYRIGLLTWLVWHGLPERLASWLAPDGVQIAIFGRMDPQIRTIVVAHQGRGTFYFAKVKGATVTFRRWKIPRSEQTDRAAARDEFGGSPEF